MFFPIHAHMRIIKATITASQTNLNLKTWLIANTLWDGVAPVSFEVDINPGVILGASNTSNSGLTIADFPEGCDIILTNNGRIQGAGGDGGRGSGAQDHTGGGGQAGGTALFVRSPVTVINNHQIWGGGGGGSAATIAYAYPTPRPCGNSGGGGAGSVPGVAGALGVYDSQHSAANRGTDGTATAGGTGGSGSRPGGAGGGPGLAGSKGTSGDGYPARNGGAAGHYVDGNTHVTWAVTGDRRGAVA